MARWRRLNPDPASIELLVRELKIGPLLARLLVERGLGDPETAHRFLHPSLSHLHDPHRMTGMRAAVQRIQRAIAGQERILIYGDYDADGTTAVVLLRKAIEIAGGQAEFHIPHRLREGYGMREEVIEHAAAGGIHLIVSVDTGIRDGPVIERANQLGIDTILTDHHLPDGQVPRALAVLNPNQPGCDYPDKNLSGVGVAFKLSQALLASLGWPPARLEKIIRSMLRLAAIGTVADVVPLTGENRVIVKFGLEALRHPASPGLKSLLASSGFRRGEPVSAGHVGFRIGPRLNAAGRMDTAADVIELLSTADGERAAALAGKLSALNEERQQAELRILSEILSAMADTGPDGAACLAPAGEGWHRGVIGIVASRLVDRFHRPAVVISIDAEERVAYGSCRSIPHFHMLEALESMSDLFLRFGGHRQAAGFSLAADRVAELQLRLRAFAATRLTAEHFIAEVPINADLALSEIGPETAARLQELEPYGIGNPEPVFAASSLRIAGEPRLIKDRHLHLLFWQEGKILPAVGWRMGERIEELQPGALLDAAFTLETDDYTGGCRLVLRDWILTPAETGSRAPAAISQPETAAPETPAAFPEGVPQP